MKNADKPAHPSPHTNWDLSGLKNGMQDGLTKREYFAGLALQGLCSNPNIKDALKGAGAGVCDFYAHHAIAFADELLTQLEAK